MLDNIAFYEVAELRLVYRAALLLLHDVVPRADIRLALNDDNDPRLHFVIRQHCRAFYSNSRACLLSFAAYALRMELVSPSNRYRKSYLASIPECSGDDRFAGFDFELAKSDFGAFVRGLNDRARGVGLPEGFVPESIYWLVEGDEYVGRVSIRHRLNDYLLNIGGHIGYYIRPRERGRGHGTQILRLALPKARALGIERVLVTCDITNVGSRKIIEANGGVLENEVEQGEGLPHKLRFWIAINHAAPRA